jgi:hypothetical protein
MSYKIQKYTFDQAKKLGVEVKPSKLKNKKIDVFKGNKKIASIGDTRYGDFATTGDIERRRLYKIRHNKTRKKVGSKSYYTDKLLW